MILARLSCYLRLQSWWRPINGQWLALKLFRLQKHSFWQVLGLRTTSKQKTSLLEGPLVRICWNEEFDELVFQFFVIPKFERSRGSGPNLIERKSGRNHHEWSSVPPELKYPLISRASFSKIKLRPPYNKSSVAKLFLVLQQLSRNDINFYNNSLLVFAQLASQIL
jgi:hypothetical protein